MDFKNKYHVLVLIAAISLLAAMILFMLVLPEFALNAAASGFATLIAFVFGLLIQAYIERKNKPIVIWGNREVVTPSFRERINKLESDLFMVGISFETTFLNYKEPISKALKENKEVKILLLNPYSKHVEGHQPFSDRDLKTSIEQTVNNRLKDLYNELSDNERKNLKVNATKYLPRFSANIWDSKVMFLNFYLYKSKANNNPVIEIKKEKNKDEFETILKSVKNLFDHPSNIKIIENGNWNGIKKEN